MKATRALTESSAAFADLGTFLPLVVGLIVLAGADPIGLLYGFGLFALGTALFYRRPIPVQPMKATAAMAVAGMIGTEVLIATGMMLGLTLILLSQTDLVSKFKRLIPPTILHGMRTALALTLITNAYAIGAISLYWTAGLLLLLVALQFTALRAFSGLLILLLGWMFLGDSAIASSIPAVALSTISLPELQLPQATAFVSALELAYLPQLALTLTNALILTAVIAQDYFPDQKRPATEKRLALSSGLANFLLAPLGAIPMCHGAGGLAAHHAMGSNTGWSIAIFGATCLLLAALFGEQVTHILTAVPLEVVAVLVLFASWHLAEPAKILTVRPSCKLIIAAMTIVALWGGLMTALVVGAALEWSISKYAQLKTTL